MLKHSLSQDADPLRCPLNVTMKLIAGVLSSNVSTMGLIFFVEVGLHIYVPVRMNYDHYSV